MARFGAYFDYFRQRRIFLRSRSYGLPPSPARRMEKRSSFPWPDLDPAAIALPTPEASDGGRREHPALRFDTDCSVFRKSHAQRRNIPLTSKLSGAGKGTRAPAAAVPAGFLTLEAGLFIAADQ
jgi:hypothetical protein